MITMDRAAEEFLADLKWETAIRAIQNTEISGYVRFGLARENTPGSAEDIVDVIAKYDARLIRLVTSGISESSPKMFVYVTASGLDGKIGEFRRELLTLGELIYFTAT
jgi:hypothetical protein